MTGTTKLIEKEKHLTHIQARIQRKKQLGCLRNVHTHGDLVISRKDKDSSIH